MCMHNHHGVMGMECLLCAAASGREGAWAPLTHGSGRSGKSKRVRDGSPSHASPANE